MSVQHRRRAIRGQTAGELFFLLLITLSAIWGFSLGARLGSTYGILGKTISAVVGLIAGVVATVLAGFLAALAEEPLDRFWRRWRPYPPVCENGTCAGRHDYETTKVPEETVAAVKGLSWLGYRCKCGNIYAGGYGYGMQNRWVRILPDGQIRPYLTHRVLGRWQIDDGSGMAEEWVEAQSWIDRLAIPGWA